MQPDYQAVAAVATFAYFLVFGDLTLRGLHPAFRILAAMLAGALVLAYVTRAPTRADRFDRNMLIALVAFAIAGVCSRFPRQSFDAVLATLLYASALFALREVLARESGRRIFIAGVMTLSALLAVMAAAQFIPPFFEWWALTGWTVFPPLDLRIVAQPWGYRHDFALLLVLLYPSWWVGRLTRLRATAALAVGLLTGLVALIDGSRTIWLAIGGGVAAIAIPMVRRGFRWDIRRTVAIGTCLAILLVVLMVSELATTLTERLFRLAPIAERGSMWGPLVQTWADSPLVGIGPGSFTWLLRLTDYFDTNSFAPRHADSAVVQLAVESGILGIAAALIVVATIAPAVFNGRSRAATFAVTVGVLCGIALNPTQLALLMAPAIGWVAFAVPRKPGVTSITRRSMTLRASSLALTSLIALAVGATVTAETAYSLARSAVDRLEYRSAASSLELATMLDPGLAMYPRQLGILRLSMGSSKEALALLERATAVNPNDDLAWRVLGLAYADIGNPAEAVRATERAIELQRSDPTNLLLLVGALRAVGDEAGARATLAEIVQAWPLIVAAPGWPEFAAPASTAELLEKAYARWEREQPSPEPLVSQRLLLGVMLGHDDATLDREPARMTPTQRAEFITVMRCDLGADLLLGNAPSADRRQPTYWALAVRLEELDGRDGRRARRLHRLMSGDTLLTNPTLQALNPLHENGTGGSSADSWGYRRSPIFWPDSTWDLPSPRSGFARWLSDPAGSVRDAGLASTLGDCL